MPTSLCPHLSLSLCVSARLSVVCMSRVDRGAAAVGERATASTTVTAAAGPQARSRGVAGKEADGGGGGKW
jgi:hypothetical protein